MDEAQAGLKLIVVHQTCHSEFGKIASLFIKPAGVAFISEQVLELQWKEHGFLAKPNLKLAELQYGAFKEQLQTGEIELHQFKSDPTTTIDSIYCRDASIATDFGMILCNMGKALRVHEPEAQLRDFANAGISVLGSIQSPGTVEGGDVAWLDEKTLAVGHTYRTNSEGISQLKNLLQPKGLDVLEVPLPHYKGPADVFHLMSVFSPIDQNLVVVYSPLVPIAFRNELLHRGFEFVEVPDNEFESMGCNVLALAPRTCLMVEGNPVTQQRLEKVGCAVRTYPGSEISVKGGGGPTCLTRPIKRML